MKKKWVLWNKSHPTWIHCHQFSMWHHFSGRNTTEKRNFEWDLLSVCQNFHHNTCGLLACEGYASQAGNSENSSVCSGKMLCSITLGPQYLLQTDHIAIASFWAAVSGKHSRENKFRKRGQHHKEGNARLYGLKRSPSGTQPFASQIMGMHPATKADIYGTSYASL